MTDLSEVTYKENIGRNKTLFLNLFWLGFIIYIVCYTISTTEQVNYVVCNVFQIIGIALMIPSAVSLSTFESDNNYIRITFIMYMCWSLGVICRGIEFDYLSIKQLLFNPNAGLFMYLAPMVLLFPKKISYYKGLCDVIVVLSIFFLLYSLIFIKQLLYPYENTTSQAIIEYFTQQLSLPAGFLLLTYVYHTRKRNLFILFILVLTFLFSVIRARRGLMFMSFSMLAFSYLIFQIVNKKKVVNMIMSFFVLIIIAYVGMRFYEANKSDTFSYITERFGQKTRSGVENYFYSDLKTTDWILGKGINGMYFCPGVEEDIGKVTIYRRVIETGYLQVILNGGIISLALFLLMAIPAMIKGMFRSKNILSKATGIWIFLFLIFSYPASLSIFSMHYLLVWISIGICFSDEIRNLSDEEVTKIFSLTKSKQ